MTGRGPGPSRRGPRARGIAAVAALLAVSLLAADDRAGRTAGDAASVVESIERIGAEAAAATSDALDLPFTDADRAFPAPLAGRLVGLAVWRDAPDDWLEWTGTPARPPRQLLDAAATADGPIWTLTRTGSVTRLITAAGPDAVGRRATATIRFDAPFGGETVTELLGLDGDDRRVVLDDGDGDGVAVVAPDGARVRVRVERTTTRTPVGFLAILTLAALAATLPRWRRRLDSVAGILAATAAIAGFRAALLVVGLPSPPLPQDLVDAGRYGTDAAGGLAGSPADLLLTAAAVLGLSRLAVRLASSARSAVRVPVLGTTGVLAGLAAAAAVQSVAADGRIRPFGPGAEPLGIAGTALVAALGLLLLAAAEPWASILPRGRAGSREASGRARRTTVGLTVVPLAAGAALLLQHGYDRVALERLRDEFAPQVLEQHERRRLALRAAVEWAADEAVARGIEARLADSPALANLVHDLWSEGPLYHAGLQSSLTFHADGDLPPAHFGFDVPPLEEPVGIGSPVREEPFELLATVRKRLLHHERPVVTGDGRRVGILVGHVLDEPDNLGFLPVSRAYLACLGGDPTPPVGAAPEYVEYSPVGVARFHTLDQPPGWTYAFDKAALENRALHVRAGGSPYLALPLAEPDRLHLLLTPAPTLLDRLGTFVRLVLLAVALLALIDGLPRLLRRGGARETVLGLRRSYLRKLVAALLVASVVPWVGLSLLLKTGLEARGEAARETAATQLAVVAQRVIEDYVASLPEESADELPDDALLYWLRRLVGQDIHVYQRGELLASSKRELFDAGLVVPHLPAEVNFQINQSNRPVLVRSERLGPVEVPVAYAPVRAGPPSEELVVAVPLVLHQPEIARALDRNVELMLLSTLLVAGTLAAIAAPMARAVARPIRDLVAAARKVRDGDYGTRLPPRGDDEVAGLTRGFNDMVAALGRQRADLERRRDYMEALLQNATTGVVSVDARGRVVTRNPAAAALLREDGAGLEPGDDLVEAIGRSPTLAPLAARLERSPRSAEPEELNLARADGAPRRLRIVRVELPDPEGGPPGRLVLLDDVTDLMRRNQLEAWAEMARAIAHEIKNPLTPIQLSAEHLERILRDRGVLPSDAVEACLETVRKQVRSLREIASEFSAYARVPAIAPEATDPGSFLREVVAPYASAPPPGIEVVQDHEPATPVAIDRRVLGRAIVNLIENGLQAMPEGGTLTVGSGPTDDGGAVLTVADTGHGLSGDARSRLFEPYFSTKSSGTGLGLAIVRRTVDGHGGRIEVDSRHGHGTTFRVILPALAGGGRGANP